MIGETGAADLQACVGVIEYLGSETLVHLHVGDGVLIGKAPTVVHVVPGDQIGARIAHASACVFDIDSGKLLATGTEAA